MAEVSSATRLAEGLGSATNTAFGQLSSYIFDDGGDQGAIQEVPICYSSDGIDGLVVHYREGAVHSHGRSHGGMERVGISLAPLETLAYVSGTVSDRLTSLFLETSASRRFGPFGVVQGSHFGFSGPVVGFSGFCNDQRLRAIGAYCNVFQNYERQ